VNLSGGQDIAYGIAVDSTGVYVAGTQHLDLWRVEKRSLINGSLIWEKAVDLGFGEDTAYGIAVDSTGVYAAGFQSNMNLWRVEKRSLTNGSLIWEKAVNLSGGWDIAHGIAVDSTGVYAAGFQNDWNRWRVEKRSLTNGSLIWEEAKSFSILLDVAYGIAVDSTGVYVSGTQDMESFWRVEQRSLTDGSLIWEKAVNLSGFNRDDIAHGIAVDSTGVYAAGFQNNESLWRVEKREKGAAPIINSPTVVTNPATNITDTSATLNGRITATGGENASERGFEWGTSSGVYPNNWTSAGNYGIGVFNRGIAGLKSLLTTTRIKLSRALSKLL